MPTSRPLPPLNPVSEWLRVIPLLLLILLVWGLEMSAAGASLDFPVASYLAVHSAFEVAAVVLAAISFGLLWMAPGSAHRSANGVLAASLAAAAGLDFLHLLSYNGMPPLVTPAGVEKGIAFWLAGRTMMTVGLLAMAFLPAQREISRARRRAVLAVAMAVAGLCAWVILYHPTWLPVTHVAGQGLTGIKVGAELVLIGLLLVTGWRLDRRARRDNDVSMAALATASVLSAAAELCFATYFSASDVLNGLGHLAKILAYWNIVRATYLMAVSQPLASVGGLADALQATLSPALLCRPGGQIRWINDAMSRATGYALADLQGQDIAYLAVSGDEVAWGQMREAMRQGRAWEGAVHVRRRDGGVYLDARKLTPIVGQQGHLSGFVMMGEDITERDRVASMLRASEERWRSLLAASPDAVLVLDEQGCIQQINPAVEHMFGYRSAELLGRSAWMLWPDAPLHVAPVAESVLAWVQSKIDTEVQRKDGSLLHVNLRSGTVSLSDGQYVVAFMRDISERIQAQAELAESEARYRTMMSTAMDGVVIFDQQTRILAVNEAYAAMSGYSRAELLQMRVADIKADLDDAGIHGYMAEVIRTGGAQFEGLHRTKSGHIYPIEATVTYSSLGGGQFFSFVRDLTERRAAEKALRESEERFELALKASNDGIWDSNVPAGTFYLSPRWKEIVGYRDDELPSNRQTFSALLHPDDGLAVLLALDDLEQGRGPERVEVEFRVRHKAGYWVPVLSRGQLVRGEQGEVIRVIGTTTDLTERKRADEALRESEDKLRNLFELSPLGIALCTLDGNLVEFNEAYRALTGYSAQDLRKLSYWDLTPPEYMRSEAEQLKVIARTGRYGPYEKEYVRADGSRIPLRFNGVRIELGGRPHIWSMVEDLTESRRVEAERQAMQQQQMQSQKLEALGHLTGGIAHDFNNMLAGIMGLASLGLERHVQDPDGKLARYLREIVRTTERGRDLVAKMLAYVRTEEPENVAPRNLAPLVGEMVDMLKSSLPSSVVLSLQCIEPLPAVRISAVDVHQIIMNLVLNARDAVGVHGEIRIRLASVTLRDEVCANCHEPVRGDFLLLEVRDNGSGIAPEALPKIFDPFFTTKDVGKGSGLGLPSVIGLAHKAGGHMQVESRPGAGTVMRVLLPAAREHVEVQEAAPEPLHIEVRECVWVVDDDPAVLVFLTELLLEHGFGVTSFSDPLEALGALRAALAQADGPLPMPSVLITDQTMPGLSGADLVRAALELDPSLRVILCTGYSEHIDADSARDLGVKHFLRKPFDSQALLRVLAEEHAELRAVAAGRRPG